MQLFLKLHEYHIWNEQLSFIGDGKKQPTELNIAHSDFKTLDKNNTLVSLIWKNLTDLLKTWGLSDVK